MNTLVALIAVSTRVFILKKISTQHGLIRDHTFIKIFENFSAINYKICLSESKGLKMTH